ncbi:hypothetical protein DLJ74_03785 [Gracilibacillus dipsosauri]|uniref:Uncharacterized protein n=1 Tax=Gracilibacillus dipsosauri TaxID=178340 RepID=A0A317L2H6_9BACI|nr:hypothetical protein DLJ74_03785 [Gracilibacillus dipsosauri]
MESIENAVMRSVAELRLLFPSEKITTKTIHEWCGMIPSKKRIQRLLAKHFIKEGNNKGAYYK